LIFASALQNSQSTLSLYLSNAESKDEVCKIQNKLGFDIKSLNLQEYKSLLCNTSSLSEGFDSFGFINVNIDEDGILRRYSLVKRYENTLIPSLSLATLLTLDKELKILNSREISILNSKIRFDDKAEVLLNFYPDDWYKKVSAIDILKGNLAHNRLRGKIVLIGSSAVALHDQVTISSAKSIAGVEVHTTMLDNILHNDLLVQPTYYRLANILLSILFTIAVLILLIRKYNNYIVGLFSAVVVVSILSNLYMLSIGVYISIGYILIPFLLHFFLVGIIFIFIDTYDRKVFSEELNRSHVALLDSMVHVAEVHDLETGAHIIRTKKYIQLLGTYIYKKGIYANKLSSQMIQMMYFTAPMHDIGKVGISDAILKKEGHLTEMEYEVMKTHTSLGKHILNNAISSYHMNDFFLMARNITEYHHEKWDGSGYPEGLKGEAIPLEARFMALADVYDALVSKRVYKEAFSYETTVRIIQEGSGTHFDPILVAAFMEIKEEFQEIAQKHSDQVYGE